MTINGLFCKNMIFLEKIFISLIKNLINNFEFPSYYVKISQIPSSLFFWIKCCSSLYLDFLCNVLKLAYRSMKGKHIMEDPGHMLGIVYSLKTF